MIVKRDKFEKRYDFEADTSAIAREIVANIGSLRENVTKMNTS